MIDDAIKEELQFPEEFDRLTQHFHENGFIDFSGTFTYRQHEEAIVGLMYLSTETNIKDLQCEFFNIAKLLTNVYINSQEKPGLFCVEDWLKVVEMGARKYAPNNWLKEDGVNCNMKSMVASIFRHIAESAADCGVADLKDKESGLHPLLHAITRCMFMYTRLNRGIVHPDDKNA